MEREVFDDRDSDRPGCRQRRAGEHAQPILGAVASGWRGALQRVALRRPRTPGTFGASLTARSNGTGKTTALEVLWPYLLDLNARQLSAGKARTTNLTALMTEESGGKRRTGYAWVTFASPEATEIVSYGVRLNYYQAQPRRLASCRS